ncbi:hypothetical protein ISF_09995 [Cordyceps fumosorosea ARSEF 2679]|uniref:Uncharacterized protein n=1 Tax=Cordyceps fumosorosea (strain ARSEF 2679) TaxID=1081104 RepID=A0A166WNN0_CORFA|nr:hypothetical protein ISF_09995 [Cordyceps fumosorosea ARSEF 2679]OAA34930.1 hypothetical protein ISF_09995 [Cordyceps fumosorosea ARSEF 2679]
MAPSHTITARNQLSMAEDGFMFIKDAALGQQVTAMVEGHIPVQSTAGFTLLKETLKEDADIMKVLRSYLQCESVGLGLYRTLGAVPGAYSFRQCNPDQPAESVLVHLLAKESKIGLWKGTDRVKVPSIPGKIGLWQASPNELAEAGLQYVEQTFDDGGWCIRDTRVFMEVLRGTALTVAIGKESVLGKWPHMKLHKSLRAIVESIETPTLKVNALFYDAE